MNTNIFDDFEEQSQEALEGLNFLNFEDFKKRNLGKDPFEGIRANKSFREISNEIALDSPFGNKSLFYKTSISNKSINQLTLGEFLVKKNIDISREQLFRLDANNTYIENVKSKYSNDLLCGDFKTNLTVHTYSGVNAARKRLETYSNNYTWFFEDDPKALNFFIYKSPFKDKVSSIVVDIGSDFFDCIKSVNISKEEAIKHLIKAFKLSFKKLKNKDLEYNLEELKKAIEDEFQAEEDYQILVGSLIEIYSSKPAVQTVLGLSKEWTEDVKKYRIDKKHYLPGEEGFDSLFFKVIRRESKKNETLPKELYEYVDDLLEANAYAVNAMVCGVINAVIDEAKNIAELPQFFYEIMTNRGSLKTFIRTVNEVLDNMLDFIIKIIKDLKKLHFGGSFYQFCYQYGYDAGFITIGVATAAIGKIIKFKKVAEFFSYFKKVANNKVFELAFRAGCIIEVDGKQLILTYNGTIIAKGTVQKLTKKIR